MFFVSKCIIETGLEFKIPAQNNCSNLKLILQLVVE